MAPTIHIEPKRDIRLQCSIYNNCTESWNNVPQNITADINGSRNRKRNRKCSIKLFEKEIKNKEWELIKQSKSGKYYESVGVPTFMASIIENMQIKIKFRIIIIITHRLLISVI